MFEFRFVPVTTLKTVIDIGHGVSHISPMYEGYILQFAVKRSTEHTGKRLSIVYTTPQWAPELMALLTWDPRQLRLRGCQPRIPLLDICGQ